MGAESTTDTYDQPTEAQIRAWAASPDPGHRLNAAHSPNTPGDVLANLFDDHQWNVRSAAVTTPAPLPEALQRVIAHSPEIENRVNLANRNDLTREVMATLALHDLSPRVREAMVTNIALPQDLYTEALTSGIKEKQEPSWFPIMLLAGLRYGDATLTRKILSVAVQRELPDVLIATVRHAATPRKVLTAIGWQHWLLPVEARVELARNPNASPRTLIRLTHSLNFRVRAAVAANPRTPASSLRRLARSAFSVILGNLAQNPSTPPDILAGFLFDPRAEILLGLAKNPATPGETLTALCRLDDTWGNRGTNHEAWKNASLPSRSLRGIPNAMWLAAVNNPNLPEEEMVRWLHLLIRGEDDQHRLRPELLGHRLWSEWADIGRNVLYRTAHLPEVWDLFLSEACPTALRIVALEHPECPPEGLMEACMAPSKYVRAAALRNPRCPEEGQIAAALMGSEDH